MKKNILISLFAVLSLCGISFAQEDYQGQLSDKKLESMGILSSGPAEKGSLEESKENSVYNYDQEYEDLLKSIHASYSAAEYELNPSLLDEDLTHHEDNYDELLKKASTILGKEKVATLTNRVEEAIYDQDSKKGAVKVSSSMGSSIDDCTDKKIQSIHLKSTNEIIQESFSLVANNLELSTESPVNGDGTDELYQNLLDDLSDGSGNEVTQLFNLASEEELENEEFQYQLDDGYPIEEITTVGLFSGQKKHFKKCLILKTYGGGTWRTYCQPIAKPTQCTDQEWRDLSTMSIMFC